MTNKKVYWIVIPLSILLVVSVAINVAAWRFVRTTNIMHENSKIQNARFRAVKLKTLRDHLNDGEIEEAQDLINLLYGIETTHLELMLNPELYPEPVNRHAKLVLEEIESSFDQTTKSIGKAVETPN